MEVHYNSLVRDHFLKPRNVGAIENADIHVRATNPVCGDEAELFLKISDRRIVQAKFLSQGCSAVIALCSFLTEQIQGLSITEARSVDRALLLERIGGLPLAKRHAATLAADLLKEALKQVT